MILKILFTRYFKHLFFLFFLIGTE